jgi:hypothetical protein
MLSLNFNAFLEERIALVRFPWRGEGGVAGTPAALPPNWTITRRL